MNTKEVWKYVVPVGGEEMLFKMPVGAEIVHVERQGPSPDYFSIWAVVNPSAPMTEDRILRVFGTGHPIGDGWNYIGTSVVANGSLVWHLFEKEKK